MAFFSFFVFFVFGCCHCVLLFWDGSEVQPPCRVYMNQDLQERKVACTPLRGVWNEMKSLGSAWGWVASLILKISSLVEPTQRIFGAPCSFFFLALSNPPSTFTFQTAPRKTTLFAGPPSNEQFLAPLLLTKYRYQPLHLEPLQLEGLEIWRSNGPQR